MMNKKMKSSINWFVGFMLCVGILTVLFMLHMGIEIFLSKLFFNMILFTFVYILGIMSIEVGEVFITLLYCVITKNKILLLKLFPFIITNKLHFIANPLIYIKYSNVFDLQSESLDNIIKNRKKYDDIVRNVSILIYALILVVGLFMKNYIFCMLPIMYCSRFCVVRFYYGLRYSERSLCKRYILLEANYANYDTRLIAEWILEDYLDYKNIISTEGLISNLILFLTMCINNYSDEIELCLQKMDQVIKILLENHSDLITIEDRQDIFEYIEYRSVLTKMFFGNNSGVSNLELYLSIDWGTAVPQMYYIKSDRIIEFLKKKRQKIIP